MATSIKGKPPITMRTTRVFEEILQAWLDGKRGILLEGGTSSSKTWSVLQSLVFILSNAKSPILCSVMSESLPHLKMGCIRDLFKAIGESQDNNPRWSKSEFIYTWPNHSQIEFWGADNEGKARGPRRNILFVNEGNNVPWSTVESADARTSDFVIVDWNPTSEFWVHNYESDGKQIPGWIKDSRFAYCHSTYLDAKKVLAKSIVDNIESKRDTDPNWWNIYGLGKMGKVEGLVYPKFSQIDRLPPGELFYGLDFGYSSDPTALTAHVIHNKNLYSHELIYETGLTNQDIGNRMIELGVPKRSVEILADAAEPKSIDEISRMGFNIRAVSKGPGSVEYGHQRVRQYEQYWTKDSVNAIKEQRNFRYTKDKDGRLTEKTTHLYSHLMDSRRYAVMGKYTIANDDIIIGIGKQSKWR